MFLEMLCKTQSQERGWEMETRELRVCLETTRRLMRVKERLISLARLVKREKPGNQSSIKQQLMKEKWGNFTEIQIISLLESRFNQKKSQKIRIQSLERLACLIHMFWLVKMMLKTPRLDGTSITVDLHLLPMQAGQLKPTYRSQSMLVVSTHTDRSRINLVLQFHLDRLIILNTLLFKRKPSTWTTTTMFKKQETHKSPRLISTSRRQKESTSLTMQSLETSSLNTETTPMLPQPKLRTDQPFLQCKVDTKHKTRSWQISLLKLQWVVQIQINTIPLKLAKARFLTCISEV